jgi:hypothetical protein
MSYLINYSNRVQEVMHDKRAELDAHLTSLNNEYIYSKKKILNERTAKISPSNQTDVSGHGRTPLNIVFSREASEDILSLVRILLEHQANPNAVQCCEKL